jgi:hypothetical protein
MLFAYSVAYGCDCATLTSEESFSQADLVFQGRVIRIEPTGSDRTVTFEVKRFLKGPSTNYISLYQGKSNCDFQFVEGWSYLVYANASGGRFVASTCSSTQVYNYRRCGSGRFESRSVYLGTLRPTHFGYGEMALITAFSVSLSISVGFLATRLWRRRNQRANPGTENSQTGASDPSNKWGPF